MTKHTNKSTKIKMENNTEKTVEFLLKHKHPIKYDLFDRIENKNNTDDEIEHPTDDEMISNKDLIYLWRSICDFIDIINRSFGY